MDKLTIHFQYDKKEYINAFRNYLFKSKVIHKRDLIIVGIMAVLEFLLLIFAGVSVSSIIFGVILCFYLFIFVLLYFVQPSHVYKRSPQLHKPYTMTFTKDELLFRTKGEASSVHWNKYCELWDCKDFYYLIQAKNIYTVIPKRALSNGNGLRDFDNILKATGLPLIKYDKQ